MIYKGYLGSHFDYLGHSSVNAINFAIIVRDALFSNVQN